MEKCFACGREHDWEDCPLKSDIKKLVITRLETMPENLRISIG